MLKKYFLSLAAACLPHLIITDDQKISVRSRYPQAYEWYHDLAIKYPSAKLLDIDFCISDHHHAGSNAIFWAEHNLQIINQHYGSISLPPTIQQLILEDEYLLLHEACHVINKHTTKGAVALVAASTTGTTLTLGLTAQACIGTISTTTALASSVLGNVALIAGIYTYVRSQEKQADEFANQNASQAALQAGIIWHQDNHKELQIQPDNSPIQKLYTEISSYKTHPSPESRMNAAAMADFTRFEAILPPVIG